MEGEGEGGPRGKGELESKRLSETEWPCLALKGLTGTAGECALLGLTTCENDWRYVMMDGGAARYDTEEVGEDGSAAPDGERAAEDANSASDGELTGGWKEGGVGDEPLLY